MAATIERVYKITADASQAIAQLDKLNKTTGNIDSKLSKTASALKGAFAGAAIAAGLTQTVRSLQATSEAMDQISKSADKFGIGTKNLIALKEAAEFSGVSFESLETGIKKLSAGIDQLARGGKSEAAKTIKELGVQVKNADGTLRDSGDVFKDLAERFSKLPAGAEKTAAALKIFGKAGSDLIPLLNEGAAGLDEFAKQAEELGLTFDDVSGKMAEAFNDNLTKLGKVAEGAKTQLMVGLLPALTAITDGFAKGAGTGDTFRTVGEKIGKTFLVSQQFISAFVDVLKNGIETISAFARTVGVISAAIATGDFATLPDAISAEWATATAEIEKNNLHAVDAIQKGWELLGQDSKQIATDFRKNFEAGIKADQPITVPLVIEPAATKGKKEKAVKDPLEDLRKSFESLSDEADPLNAALEDIAAKQKTLNDAMAAGIGTTEEYAKIQDELARQLFEVADATDDVKKKTSALDEIGAAIGDTLSAGVAGFVDTLTSTGSSFKQWAADIVVQIAKVVAQLMILKALKASSTFGSFFAAQGAAFSSLGLPYGVYTQPTQFAMAGAGKRFFANGGVGVFAEAGPEAIMPLRRDGSGRLGVDSTSPVVNVNIHNNTDSAISAQRNGSEIDIIINRVAADIIRGGGRVSKAIETTYKMGRS